MISTSKWHAKHLFAGQNTQQWTISVTGKTIYLGALLSRNVRADLFLNFCGNTFTILFWHLLALLSWQF